MKFDITYEHMKDELNLVGLSQWIPFYEVVEAANKNELELSDDDFALLYKLRKDGHDIRWVANYMGKFNVGLSDALVAYIL
jgi:hypothetical protein